MTENTIDLRKTVNTLCTENPALVEVLANLGFTEIVKPIMLATVGKVMTLPKGAAMRALDLSDIIAALEAQGYRVIGNSQEE